MISLSVFLILYLIYLGVFVIFGFFNLYIMLRYGFVSFWAYLITFGFVVGSLVVIGVSFYFIAQVDWTQTIALGVELGN